MQSDTKGNVVLSVREAQVLRELCQDAPSDKEIGGRLKMAERTVCAHMKALREGLGHDTRGSLIIWGKHHPQSLQGVAAEPSLHGRHCHCGSMLCPGKREA